MTRKGTKRRRLKSGSDALPITSAQGASYAALGASLRLSLAHAGEAAALAATAQSDASAAAARAASALAETAALNKRSLAAAQASQSAAARALATASALAKAHGVEVDDGAAKSVEAAPVAVEGVKKVSDGGDCSTTIFDLPDTVVEKIFDILAEVSTGDSRRRFPCCRALANFALCCPRFAALLRGSYVNEIQFDALFRFAPAARVYHEAISGALVRFTNVETVCVVNSDCFDDNHLDQSDYQLRLDRSREVQYRVAAADRRSLPEAGVASHRMNRSISKVIDNIKTFRFNVDYNTSGLCEINFKDGLSWEPEQPRWLDYFRAVTSVMFEDWRCFISSSRVCGVDFKESLQVLGVDTFWFFRPGLGYPPESKNAQFLLELVHYRNVETLVLNISVDDVRKADEPLDIVAMLELLPKLQTLGIVFDEFCEDGQPVLDSIFRNPEEPAEVGGKPNVYVGFENCLLGAEIDIEDLYLKVAGKDLRGWELVGSSDRIFTGLRGPSENSNPPVVVLATYTGVVA